MSSVTTLLVVAKAPVAGRVKTRLCPPCRPEQAAAVAEAALADTLEAVLRCGAERRLLALDGAPGDWLPRGYEVVPQVDGTFQQRLAAAWSEVAGPCVQIGMDTPQVAPTSLDLGLDRVVAGGSVLGLATDGGWWAIGMPAPVPAIFETVPMSTDDTGSLQLTAMRRAGLHPTMLPELRDIDTFDDALAVATEIPGSRTAEAVLGLVGSRSA